MITDAAGAALDVNELAQRTLPAELGAGASLAECVHPADRGAFEAAWAGLTSATGAATSLRFRRADGAYASFVMSARRAEGQPWVYVQLSAPPPAKSAERSGRDADVEQDARILRAMLEEMDISVWAIDTRGAYTFQEGKALLAMGLRPRQQLGQSVFDIFEEQSNRPARQALAGERVDLVIPLGDVIWETAIRPLRDEQGHIEEPSASASTSPSERRRGRARDQGRAHRAPARGHPEPRDPHPPGLGPRAHAPMIGVVDSRRAARVMEDLLDAVMKGHARFAILDLTGVEVVDSATANHLIGLIRAIRLLGAEGSSPVSVPTSPRPSSPSASICRAS